MYYNPPVFMLSAIGIIIGAYHLAQVFVEMGHVKVFCLCWVGTMILLISASAS
jgi:hypothetical protein